MNKRNMEVTLMDKRISELRERLYKKKAEARQKENLPVRLGVHLAHRHKHSQTSVTCRVWKQLGLCMEKYRWT